MLSAKKLVKKQKKAVARQEETKRLILAARMAVKDVLEGVRRARRLEELKRGDAVRDLLDRGVRRSGRPICVNTKTGESK